MRNSRREANVVWSDSHHFSAHLRATPEEGGVGIWEVVFQKNPVTKRGHQLRRGFRPRRRVESQATLWDLCRSSPDPGGNGRTALNSSSHEALPHSLTVWSPDPVRCIR